MVLAEYQAKQESIRSKRFSAKQDNVYRKYTQDFGNIVCSFQLTVRVEPKHTG